MDISKNFLIDSFERNADIARRALVGMAYCWEQFEDEPSILSDNYPFEKSFDEVVFEFSEWIDNWISRI